MANDDKFYSMLIREIGLQLFFAAPARIIKVYDNHTADIKPLFKTEDNEGNVQERSPVLGARILEHVGVLEPGDVVHVNFTDRSIDNLKDNQTFHPGFLRVHSINDAVIVGRYRL